MEVSVRTENELKELIRFRMNKEIDDEYIQLLAEIMNSDPIFQGQIIIERTDNKTLMSMNYQDFKVRYNLEFLKSQFAKSYVSFQRHGQFDFDLPYFYGYWIPFCFIHEVNHVYQLLCGGDSISEYSEINDLYRKLFNSFRQFRDIDRKIYIKCHDKYCMERNANLNAANFLVDVFDQTELYFFSASVQINHLLWNGYCLKRGKVISPVEQTFKYLRIKDKVEGFDLPFKVLFEHGFKITDEDFHFIYDDFLRNKKQVDYYETIGKVKTLIKRDEDSKNLSK